MLAALNVRGLLILASLALAGVAFYQGVYVLRTGKTTLFYVKNQAFRMTPRLVDRLIYGAAYLLSGMFILVILGIAISDLGTSHVEEWITDNGGMLIYSLLFMATGMLYILRPTKMLMWTIRYRPEAARDRRAVAITRIIGAGFLAIGVTIFAGL